MSGPIASPLVTASRLTKTYFEGGGSPALADVSLDICSGDRIAVIGRSGSGKSTLLQLIAGLDDPTGGTLLWPGLGSREDLRPGKVAIMMQAPSLVPWLNVVENIALVLELAGNPRKTAQDRARHALTVFGLDDLEVKLPDELSGGQAQRVSLGRATATEPTVLLADEPTGQLDRATAQHLMDALLMWADRTGAALVVATHDRDVARQFDLTLTLDHGRVSAPLQRNSL